MTPDHAPVTAALLIFAASLLSLRLGISVAIFEALLGLAAGALGLRPPDWMLYLAGFGGLVLTFLAGAEVDMKLLRENFRGAAAVSAGSFLAPLAAGYLFCRYAAGWSAQASLVTGVALSETSLAVVYSVLAETGRAAGRAGRLLMVCTFLTNSMTALALSLLFLRPGPYTLLFLGAAAAFLLFSGRFTLGVLRDSRLAGKVAEPEVKYIFFVLLAFAYLAERGSTQAILPAFAFGLVMARHFRAGRRTSAVKTRLRTVAYAFITPFFFITAGLKVSLAALWGSAWLFAGLFAVKQVSKLAGVWLPMRRFFPRDAAYSTLMLSTGLTFGLIAVLAGLKAGWLSAEQYSVLTGVLLASAVVPTFAAQRWFPPRGEEDPA